MEKQSYPSADQGSGSYFQVSVDIASLQEFPHLLQSQPKNLYSESWRGRQIEKVPMHIRRRVQQRSEQVYDPVMISIGPYHHGKPELRRGEEFKHLCLSWRDEKKKKKALFYSKILENVDAIRDSYAEATIVEKYDDESLALMMVLDGSILIDFIRNFIGMKGDSFLIWERCLGAASGPFMIRDMMLIENQIPFQVLRLLIGLQFEENDASLFLPRFITKFSNQKTGIQMKLAGIPQEKEDPPIHFLEAFWRVVVKKHKHTTTVLMHECSNGGNSDSDSDHDVPYTHPSVMDLKAKGIRVECSSTRSLRDIKFSSNKFCFSQLELPLQCISDLSPVIWSNLIAFEVLPNRRSTSSRGLVVLSYFIFMKSLIQSPEDVKELQERGILVNKLANLDKIVELIKEVDTFGLHDQDIFKDVKRKIEEHCNSRAKTWTADLIYTRFRTPWTALALFAAVLLLCLTFLQTFFTING